MATDNVAPLIPPGTLGTVRNAVLLLQLLSEGPPYQQLTDLADRSDLSLPTVHRLLRSLSIAGLVEQDPDSLRYGLGPELVRLSERYLSRLPAFRAMAPYLVELRNSTNATIVAGVLARGWIIYVDRVDGEDAGGVYREPVRMRPALETAAGRLLASRVDGAAWREAVSTSNGHEYTAGDREDWANAPFLIAEDPLHGLVEAAVPVLAGDGRPVASLAASGNVERYTEDVLREHVVPQLARAAAAAGRTLSHA